jgi:SAM-dependent methyltransferase
MLADKVRMEAYRKAILDTVKNGDVVADIGTGSGILAFFAVQAGAKKVYAIEENEIIEEAKELAKINGLEKNIVFIKGRSDKVELPEKVDIITSELIGFFGLEEKLLRFTIDARNRFLKPGGKLVPSWLELFLVPIESEAFLKENLGVWNSDFYGCDFLPVRSYAVSQRYITDCSKKARKIASPSMISHINFYEIEKVPRTFQGKFVINRKATFIGFVGYFQAGLSENVVLSTSPEKPLTHWQQTFFPLQDDVGVEGGDEISCRLIAIPIGGNLFWQWKTGVSRNGDEIIKYSQSNLHIKKEEIVIRKKNFTPILTETGEIFRRVFELCNGHRTIGEIAEILWKEYPEKYSDNAEVFEAVIGILRGRVKIN